MELWFWLPQVEIVLDAVLGAVLLLLVQLWFSVCSMEKEESPAWVRSLFAQADRVLSRLTGRGRVQVSGRITYRNCSTLR